MKSLYYISFYTTISNYEHIDDFINNLTNFNDKFFYIVKDSIKKYKLNNIIPSKEHKLIINCSIYTIYNESQINNKLNFIITKLNLGCYNYEARYIEHSGVNINEDNFNNLYNKNYINENKINKKQNNNIKIKKSKSRTIIMQK